MSNTDSCANEVIEMFLEMPSIDRALMFGYMLAKLSDKKKEKVTAQAQA